MLHVCSSQIVPTASASFSGRNTPRLATCRVTPIRHANASRRVGIGSQPCAPRRVVVSMAQNSSNGAGFEERAKMQKERDLRESLERSGMTSKTARRIVEVWNSAGISDPEMLRKLLKKQTIRSIGSGFFQLALDAGAASATYSLGQEWLFDGTFGRFTPLASSVVFTLSGYFAAGFFIDIFRLLTISFASGQFRSNSSVFMAAVKDIAGNESGLDVLDKANEAVNMVKVIDALNKIQDALKAESASGSNAPSTLSDLGAYLTLANAESKYNFDASKYGMSSDEAMSMASTFSKFDVNDDGRLELSEFQDLASTLPELSLSPEESTAAFDLIDTDNSRYIEFNEFAQWWNEQVQPKPGSKKEKGEYAGKM